MRVLVASFFFFFSDFLLSVVDFVPTGTVAQTLGEKSNPQEQVGPRLRRSSFPISCKMEHNWEDSVKPWEASKKK